MPLIPPKYDNKQIIRRMAEWHQRQNYRLIPLG